MVMQGYDSFRTDTEVIVLLRILLHDVNYATDRTPEQVSSC